MRFIWGHCSSGFKHAYDSETHWIYKQWQVCGTFISMSSRLLWWYAALCSHYILVTILFETPHCLSACVNWVNMCIFLDLCILVLPFLVCLWPLTHPWMVDHRVDFLSHSHVVATYRDDFSSSLIALWCCTVLRCLKMCYIVSCMQSFTNISMFSRCWGCRGKVEHRGETTRSD